MKDKKIEIRLTYFLISLAIMLLNIKSLSFLGIVIGSFLSFFLIFLSEKFNLYQYKLTRILLVISAFFFMIFYLNKITYFIGDNILRNYSLIVISLTILVAIYLLVRKGYHTVIKVIILSSYFLIFFFLLGFLITLPYINLTNLNLQILISKNLLTEIIYYAFLMLYTYFLIYPISKTKFKIYDLIGNTSYQVINYLSILSILGTTLMKLYQYPYIVIFKKVNLIGFIERIEIIFSLNYLFNFFFLLLLSFYQIKYNLDLVIKKDKKAEIFLIFITIIIFFLNLLLT